MHKGCLMRLIVPCVIVLLGIAARVPQVFGRWIDPPQIYQGTERELDQRLRDLHKSQPDYHARLLSIARLNIDQPYEIYLLGEAPFETIDGQPVYCLGKSDCVVFVEHSIAMALSDNFRQFLSMLQRIRYKDGQIGVRTRNHYTEADWNKNNSWLVTEITSEIAGDATVQFTQKVNRAKFFKDRYKIDVDVPVETITESYIPYEKIDGVKSRLRSGDIVNFVTGNSSGAWVGHVGLVAVLPDGTVNLIHSAAPKVREETIEAYIERATKDAADKDKAGKARFRGFKFLRLADDPWTNLRKIDGDAAPKVLVPPTSPITWQQYLDSFKLED